MIFNNDKLASLLERRGMTQADLARLTGWSESKVSRYMHGNTGDLTLTSLRELAAALQASPASLVDLDDVAQTDAERALLHDFRIASERDRRLARAQVKPVELPAE